jgi:tryptophan synthase alpha chain
MAGRLAPSRLSAAFAKGRPALVCFITAGGGGVATNPDAPADAPVAKV